MELSPTSQIAQVIDRSNSFVVSLPENPGADTIASGLALMLYLQALGKRVDVVSSGKLPGTLAFLPGVGEIKQSITPSGGTFGVVLDTSKIKLSELSYDTKDTNVTIFLKAKEGMFAPSDISFQTTYSGYDAVFILGSPSLESLGPVFANHTELFYDLPKINIDTNPQNTYFGNINFVDVTSVSVSEILAKIFEELGKVQISEQIATCLLTGIIAATSSFQSVVTTPRAFTVASDLINRGAQQQEIIRHLFKTKAFSMLKLWGRALARLKPIERRGSAYTVLSSADFEKTSSDLSVVPEILRESLDNMSDLKVFAVVAEFLGSVYVFATVHPQLDLGLMFQEFGATPVTPQKLQSNSMFFSFQVADTLQNAEIKLTEILTKILPES